MGGAKKKAWDLKSPGRYSANVIGGFLLTVWMTVMGLMVLLPLFHLLLPLCLLPSYRLQKPGRGLSDAVTMTTSTLSVPFWFRALKTRFICKVGYT